ncbi:LysR family transcriptional regulator [Acetobacter sp. TBRC 12305]|uniref:LysR family transcriptional regulator n=1 Tax=Acetobacter garciniae TaxID=2817435 RepID=A0A939HQG7_9PROT|nr:LysR family transcriptional regulator [Acetobacter garciniae]MBO1325699.1 LysR family transcriptional regulator [Acetobacter garciniae]MBX0345599.1 LysR family transcriptional regulator [Acetobacter garciniae]
MDTRHMHIFMALAETLHFGRAAERMSMSQPPFSRQIAMIERMLGVKLFERNSRNVALTPAGEHFMKDCRTVLAQFEDACRDVRLVASGMKGELRFGFMMHAAHSVVPQLVQLYSEARPDVRLVLDERTPTEIDEMLVGGTLDAAVTFGCGYTPHLQTVLLTRERLRIIMRADHPLAGAAQIGPAALRAEKIIATPVATAPALRSAINSYFSAKGIVPNVVFEPRLQHTIIQLVAKGLGIALIPESLCAGLGAGLTSGTLTDPPQLDVVLCAPIVSKNPAVSTFMQIGKAIQHASKSI